MKARMKCAWCGKDMRSCETYDGNDSHGICKKCLKKQMDKLDKEEKKK